jgi:hypothetical protein
MMGNIVEVLYLPARAGRGTLPPRLRFGFGFGLGDPEPNDEPSILAVWGFGSVPPLCDPARRGVCSPGWVKEDVVGLAVMAC